MLPPYIIFDLDMKRKLKIFKFYVNENYNLPYDTIVTILLEKTLNE